MSEKNESWKKLPLRVIGRSSSRNPWRDLSSPVESSSLQTRLDSSVMSDCVLSIVLTVFSCLPTSQTLSLMLSLEIWISTDRGWRLLTVGISLAWLGMFILSFFFIVSQISFGEQLDSSHVFSTELVSFLSVVLERSEFWTCSSLIGMIVVLWWDCSSCWNRRRSLVRVVCFGLQLTVSLFLIGEHEIRKEWYAYHFRSSYSKDAIWRHDRRDGWHVGKMRQGKAASEGVWGHRWASSFSPLHTSFHHHLLLAHHFHLHFSIQEVVHVHHNLGLRYFF